LLSLFLDAVYFNCFCTKLKAGEAPFISEVIALFQIGYSFVEIMSRKKFELPKRVRKKFSSRCLSKEL